jgi:hypothetical protein
MVRARRYGLAALFVAATVVTLAACGKPQLGGKCTAGQSACVDAKSGLFCGSDGTYKAMPCAGDKGCVAQGAKAMCDNDVASIGDGCDQPNDGACAPDHKAMLLCTDEKFVLRDTCKGPGACKVQGDMVMCDNDIADVGDPCGNKGNFACASDKTTAMRCGDDNKYAVIQTCHGPNGCKVVHDPKNPKMIDIDCDRLVANEKEPCFPPGEEACSLDKKTKLVCQGPLGKSTYGQPTPCPGPNACVATWAGKKSVKAACDTSGGDTPPAPADDKKGGKKKKH